MAKLWLIARHEYRRLVRRRSFLLGTLAIPLLIAVVMGITIAIATGSGDTRPVGVVDDAGVLAAGARAPVDNPDKAIEFRAYADKAAATAALEAGEIQAAYLLPADYLETGFVRLIYWEKSPGDAVWDQFKDTLRANLAAGLPEAVRARAVEGPTFTVRSADGSREIEQRDFMRFVMPFVAGLFFMLAVMTSSGYLLQAVTTEKENRTMEVMITSLTPGQLIVGKAIGLMGVSLTQLGIWALAIAIGLVVGAQFLEPLAAARVPWASLGVIVLYFFPAYALVAGIMVAIGSAVTETQQGQQVSGILNLLFIMPFFFVALILANPNSPVLVVLSLFPTTAFLTITMRWSLAVVPLWQMVLSWSLLVVSAGFCVWAAARVLRVGMLRYGQRLDLRALLRAVRARS